MPQNNVLSREKFKECVSGQWVNGGERMLLQHDAALREENARLELALSARNARARQCVNYLGVPLNNPSGEPFDELSQAIQSMPTFSAVAGLRSRLEAAPHAHGCQIQTEPHCLHCHEKLNRHFGHEEYATVLREEVYRDRCKDGRGRPETTSWTPVDPLPCNCWKSTAPRKG
jgi:hypothetical protein